MNSRILLSAVSVLATVGLVGGTAYALFSDAGVSSGNVFAAGTLDLKLTDNNEDALDNVAASWSGINMAPGGTPVTGTLNLKNSGTVNGSHVFLKAANTVTDNPTAEDNGAMSSKMVLTTFTFDANDLLPSLPDANGNGVKDLQDLEIAGDGMDIGALSDLNSNHPLVLSVQLNSNANNTYQGDSVSTDFTVTLHQ